MDVTGYLPEGSQAGLAKAAACVLGKLEKKTLNEL